MTSPTPQRDGPRPARMLPRWLPSMLFAVAALCAVLPLVLNGASCGHDFDFHLLSWMEAAHQWQHGVLKPVWAFTPAYNAGEPRLLFYPPLSWVTGAALGMLLPWPAVPAAFTALVLFLCGLSMQRLLGRWTSPTVAMLGGCLYLVNPYMLFVAYERTAYGELLAAAWMPLLLAALLRERVTVTRVALPVALLWLTNAPAAVLGCYTVLLLGLVRLCLMRGSIARMRLAGTLAASVLLAGLLDAFYLLPLLLERRYISLDMAVVPIARPDHNFLFQWDKDAFHTHVLVQASWIAIALCVTGALCGTLLLLFKRERAVVAFRSMHARSVRHPAFSRETATVALLLFLLLVFFLLTRWSLPFWHLPELVYVQFPWRFNAVAAATAVALVALFLDRVASRMSPAVALSAGLLIALSTGWFAGGHYFREECADDETVAAQRHQFVTQEGVGVTDEYTPADADNDDLPISAPAAWLASEVGAEPDKQPVVPRNSHPTPEVFHFFPVSQSQPAWLVVRLRQFPGWHTLRDGVEIRPAVRQDGLIAVPLSANTSHEVDVVYRTPWDQWLGMGISAIVFAASVMTVRSRRSGIMKPPE